MQIFNKVLIKEYIDKSGCGIFVVDIWYEYHRGQWYYTTIHEAVDYFQRTWCGSLQKLSNESYVREQRLNYGKIFYYRGPFQTELLWRQFL